MLDILSLFTGDPQWRERKIRPSCFGGRKNMPSGKPMHRTN
jgi:hypothetical protein